MPDPNPVVFVHGLGSTYEHNWVKFGWTDLVEAEGRKAVGHNMAGHGGSPRFEPGETGPSRLHQLAQDLGGKVDIVAFSAGSVLSLTSAVLRPDLFGKLVLMGVGDGSFERSLEQKREGLRDPDSPALRGIRLAAERAGNNFEDVMWSANNTYPVPSFDEMSVVTSPVLLLVGEQDFVLPADKLAANLPQAQLKLLRNTDHFSTTQKFEAQDATLAFLAEG